MNPVLGVIFHWLGGFASGSFYVPFRGVKRWSWETSWLVGGIFSWFLCPTVLALILTKDLLGVLLAQSAATLGWSYLFGALWGIGGLTFGLTMRYLGLSLGMGIALGFCAALGTLLPPIGKLFIPSIPVAESIVDISRSTSGKITLAGVLVCLLGILTTALAGLRKEKDMSIEEKKKAISEFSFSKGVLIASFSGVMSACFSFALTAAAPIGVTSANAGTSEIWTGLPKLVVVLLGGLTTNGIWCVFLNIRNRTGYQYFARSLRTGDPALASTSGEHYGAKGSLEIPFLRNLALCALAGTTWYFQFFFYTMGETQMGNFAFASWTLHMASIIIFSTAWGIYFKEWKGASPVAHRLIALGVIILVFSTVLIGYGSWHKGH